MRESAVSVADIEFYPVERWEVDAFWPKIEPFARQMARREPDTWPVQEQRRQAEAGLIDLWLAWSEEQRHLYGIMATRLVIKASGVRWMTVPFAAGHQHKIWAEAAERHVAELARLNACTAIESYARDGWGRAVPGYRRVHSVYRKELT